MKMLIVTRPMSQTRFDRLMFLPNIFKWNEAGSITHIGKQNRDPIMADISSNDGIAIASKMITTSVINLNMILRHLVRNFDWLKRFGLSVAARGSILVKTSRVDIVGAMLQST